MALTRTRTRTQTTLNKLAQRTAEINGELAFVETLLADCTAVTKAARLRREDVERALAARRAHLEADRDALYATLRQFDPEIDPTAIGRSEAWRKRVMPRARARGAAKRYIAVIRPPG